MRIYIDTNTFPASPALYADAEKTKPLPRILPAVELQRGGFEVAFIGSNQPQDIATVALAASIEGTQTQVVAELGEETDDGEAWRFDFALNSESLVAEVANRGSARLRVGIIVEDDTERREWQFTTVVYPTASSGETDVEAVESAKDWAELAEQSAKYAQEAQADVAGNAQLAENAKQTAMQAANAAIGAADDAEVAERNAAESKNAAEKAKTDAESAKAAAQKAASDAQATLANVYTKSQIDGVDTGAEVVLKMNEIISRLKECEEEMGAEFPLGLYEQTLDAFQRWMKNPNEEKRWNTTSSTESTNPYYANPPTKPVVDFNVVEAKGVNTGYPSFSKQTKQIIFLPNVKSGYSLVRSNSTSGAPLLVWCTDSTYLIGGSMVWTAKIFAPATTQAYGMCQNCLSFNHSVYLPNLSSGSGAFRNTAMSAENISATLDSLPEHTDGKSHVITFTGSPGAAELTQESPSVAAAIAKGWTVEL